MDAVRGAGYRDSSTDGVVCLFTSCSPIVRVKEGDLSLPFVDIDAQVVISGCSHSVLWSPACVKRNDITPGLRPPPTGGRPGRDPNFPVPSHPRPVTLSNSWVHVIGRPSGLHDGLHAPGISAEFSWNQPYHINTAAVRIRQQGLHPDIARWLPCRSIMIRSGETMTVLPICRRS
jgi:hypothetical protein